MAREISTPVFFIGFPRSGTTIAFEAFSRHESLGWLSTYTERFPGQPWLNSVRRLLDNRRIQLIGKKGSRYNKTILGNRYLPQSAEAYRFWDRHSTNDFSRSSLRNRVADPKVVLRTRDAVRRILIWQGRPRFAAKITGPSRISFLNSIFPDAIFIHIVRDGRATVHSLLNVAFWREKHGLVKPFWSDTLTEDDLQIWERSNRDPGVLAALQWKRVLEGARIESKSIRPHRYMEVRYEAFVDSPHAVLREIYDFCGLKDSTRGHDLIKSDTPLANMNDKYRSDFSSEYIKKIVAVMEPQLQEFDYGRIDD